MTSRNILIIGDSYSTSEGYIPEGFACYYTKVTERKTDVTDVSLTWWQRLAEETGSKIVLNNSWSGSTICYTGYGGTDTSKTSSFLHRVDVLSEKGFFKTEKIDTVLVFGGTNDSWANAPIGSLSFGEKSREELYSVLPAICRLTEMLKSELPEAEIVLLINTDIKQEIQNGIKAVAEHYGVRYVIFEQIDKSEGHPTAKGMEQIKEAVKNALS
jgi:lysophospholipase L1-like esterase